MSATILSGFYDIDMLYKVILFTSWFTPGLNSCEIWVEKRTSSAHSF